MDVFAVEAVGSVAVVTIDFSRAETPVDPSSVRCFVRWRREETELPQDDIISGGDGVYTVRFTVDKTGDWYVRVEGVSGEDTAAAEVLVTVPASPFAREAVA